MEAADAETAAVITAYAAIPMAEAASYAGAKFLRMCALVLQDSSVGGTLTFRVTTSSAAATISLPVLVDTTDSFTFGDTPACLLKERAVGDITLFAGTSLTDLGAVAGGVEDFTSFLVCVQLNKYYPELLHAAGTLILTAMFEPTGVTAVSSSAAELAVSKIKLPKFTSWMCMRYTHVVFCISINPLVPAGQLTCPQSWPLIVAYFVIPPFTDTFHPHTATH
ncbi:MAG: hypothetical protein EOM68_23845 [Spirochaetia bacterium]|nr:hypothetical protein [Spirochaetia bacterium]